MDSKAAMKIAGAGVAGGVLALAGFTLASAATGSNETAAVQTQTPGAYGYGPMHGGGGPGAGETPLTGETADKVTAAAQAEVPDGTVLRVETDSEGTYEAHVRKADGTEVIVLIDDSFAVTSVVDMPAHGPGGMGGPRSDEEPLTGAKGAKVKEAAEEAVPNGTVIRVETDADGVYEAHVLKPNGTMVVVHVNKSFRVTDVEKMAARGHFGPPAGHQAPQDSNSEADA